MRMDASIRDIYVLMLVHKATAALVVIKEDRIAIHIEYDVFYDDGGQTECGSVIYLQR